MSGSSVPAVSVLVTVYNRARWIAQCLDSILASSWQDFEVVVVDDASADNSVEIIEKYAARDPRVLLHRNERNLGDYPNRNRAASLARGRFLKYLDADDTIYPHSLELMVNAMLAAPAAALGLSWNVIDPPVPYPFVSTPSEVYHAHFLGKSLLGVGPSAAIMSRDAFLDAGGFSGTQFVGDTELWLKLAERSPVISLPPSLVYWRRHEGQQMHLELKTPEVLNIRYRLDCSAMEGTANLSPGEKLAVGKKLRHNHARRLSAFLLRSRRPREFWRLFRTSGLSLFDLLGGLRGYR